MLTIIGCTLVLKVSFNKGAPSPPCLYYVPEPLVEERYKVRTFGRSHTKLAPMIVVKTNKLVRLPKYLYLVTVSTHFIRRYVKKWFSAYFYRFFVYFKP